MNNTTRNTDETERIAGARESFSGRLLSDAQFDEAIDITRIIEREIERSGTFKDKLSDYAHAYARSQRIDAQRAENIVRDLYKERTGQTMTQAREALVKHEEALSDTDLAQGYEHAVRIGERVERGDKMAFSRAYATEAQEMARKLCVTDSFARRVMTEEFQAAETMKLADWGKELDAQHFQPQIEAEKERRAQARGQSRSSSRSQFNSDSSASQEQQDLADGGWDHGRDVDAGDHPTRSAVPRAGSRSQGRVSRGHSGQTRTGP